MPSFGHTPEALLGRNDSKNPTTTCKGLTASGRPCRRALGERTRKSVVGGVVALVHEDGQMQEADFYCWQHKDQAQARIEEKRDTERETGSTKKRSLELYTLRERNSIDTFVERLGIHGSVVGKPPSIKKPKGQEKAHRQQTSGRPRPQYSEKQPEPQFPTPRRTKPKRSAGGFWAALCCMTIKEDDYIEVVRHRKRSHSNHQRTYASVPKSSRRPITTQEAVLPVRLKQNVESEQRHSIGILNPPTVSALNRHTTDLLSLIPSHLPPQTTSALLAELIKPISPTDEEGYIYIFWLTPQNKATPPEATARSLLAPTSSRPHTERRISDVMTEFSYGGLDEPSHSADAAAAASHGRSNKTHQERHRNNRRAILLKIGRASNVTRRMNEWQRQCGYALTLVRWYPYVSKSASSPSPSQSQSPSPSKSPSRQWQDEIKYPDLPHRLSNQDGHLSQPQPQPQQHQQRRRSSLGPSTATIRKVPNVKRVERLIHLELSNQQVKRQCEVCGKEHREWFQIEASRAGVSGVDEVVKRWVDWAESNAHGLVG